jgi:uncharacterized protein DUF4129
MRSGLLSIAATVPVEPDRVEARRLAVTELSRREYQEAEPGVIERILIWLRDFVQGLDLGHNPPARLGMALIVVLIAAAIAYAIHRSGGLRATARRRGDAVLPDRPTAAADHRAAADRHAAAEEWDDAVRERFRAIARELEERAVLNPQPGRTADELATRAGRELPALAGDLVAAAHRFDDVTYGSLPAGPPDDASLRALDDQVRAARLVSA